MMPPGNPQIGAWGGGVAPHIQRENGELLLRVHRKERPLNERHAAFTPQYARGGRLFEMTASSEPRYFFFAPYFVTPLDRSLLRRTLLLADHFDAFASVSPGPLTIRNIYADTLLLRYDHLYTLMPEASAIIFTIFILPAHPLRDASLRHEF